MIILFATPRLRELCNSSRQQNKELGIAGAKKLRSRLADLAAADRLGGVVAGSPHPLTGDRAGQFAINLDGGRRLVFEPADDPVPRHPSDRSIQWPEVRVIRIVFIGDYHD